MLLAKNMNDISPHCVVLLGYCYILSAWSKQYSKQSILKHNIGVCSFLSLRDQVLHPCKTSDIVILYVLIFMYR
jgi:hypothetical protein